MTGGRAMGREELERILARKDPERHALVESLPEEARADFYDRLGEALWEAVEEAALYGTEGQRRARTRAAVREQILAGRRERGEAQWRANETT